MKFGLMLSEKGKNYFYIMHLSYNGRKREDLWRYAKENNLIGLDAPGIVKEDWVTARMRKSVTEKLGPLWVRQFEILCNEMHRGDIVITINGWDSLLGIAEIIGRQHSYNRELSISENFFDHIRQVEWIRKCDYANRLSLAKPLVGFNNTLSKVSPSSPRWSMLTNLDI